MNDNDFNADSGQNHQNGQIPFDSQDSGSTIPRQYAAPQYGQQNENPSSPLNESWQTTNNSQNHEYQDLGFQDPVHQLAQPGQAPLPYNGTIPPAPNYQPHGPVPPANPGYMPPTGPQGYYPPTPNQKWNTLCIIGFALSFFMPLIGLILSVIALRQINRSGEKSKGMSIAGIAIGAVLTVLDIIVAVVIVSAFSYAFNHMNSDYSQCHGSDCYSDPFGDDGDDPDDEDNEDTNYTYYRYDYSQGSTAGKTIIQPNVA